MKATMTVTHGLAATVGALAMAGAMQQCPNGPVFPITDASPDVVMEAGDGAIDASIDVSDDDSARRRDASVDASSKDAQAKDAAPEAAPAPPKTTCAKACDALARFSCDGADASDCTSVLQNINDRHLVRTDAGKAMTCACLASATSAAGERACGARCP